MFTRKSTAETVLNIMHANRRLVNKLEFKVFEVEEKLSVNSLRP
jgi:hypothetical protein